MTSNETEFWALLILKGSSAGRKEEGKTQYRIRPEKRGPESRGVGGGKGYNLECKAELKPHILPPVNR